MATESRDVNTKSDYRGFETKTKGTQVVLGGPTDQSVP